MKIKAKGLDITYNDKGKGIPIILLHGWGQNKEMMNILGDTLEGYRRISIDLPGFGESSEPKEVLSVKDYAEIVHEIINKLDIKPINIVGHSFGGRIGAKYASMYHVDHLVLLAAPLYKTKETYKTKLVKALGKIIPEGLKEKLKKHIGSSDYKKASKVMREILIEHINTDLSEDIKKVNTPTLLIWGTDDKAVSVRDARKAEKEFKDAALIEIPYATHYAYIEHLGRVSSILNNFFGGK